MRPGPSTTSSSTRTVAARPFAAAERLLQELWGRRDRGVARRELAVELAATAVLLAAAIALAVLVDPARQPGPAVLAGLVVVYAVASRVAFAVGGGFAVPTQVVLVPMLFVAAPTHVPLLVGAGLLLGALVEAALGRSPRVRVVFAGGDAIHALGPAVVLAVAGQPTPGAAGVLVLVAAFAAGWFVDLLASLTREWLANGTPPAPQASVLLVVWAIDVLLTPIGLVVAHVAADGALALTAVPPLVALLALLVRERESRLAQAQARLDALQRERGRLRVAVRRIGEAFGTRLDLDALLGVTLGAAAEALDADAAHASRGGEECARRGDAARFAEVLAAAEAAARAGDAVTAVAVGADHALAAPVGAEGVIAVARGEAPFAPDERELFAYLAAQAALSARDIARHDELSRQALTDGLTGLANHRRFHERLHDDAARAARRGAPLSLVLVDLDDFKAVNDTHGHQAGDAVLREVAARLALAVPAGTEPARYGGEELAVALPGLALPEAEAVAERARAAIRAQPVALPDGGALTVTASLGVAPLGADGDPDALVATADAALYSAKAAGKDRVVVAAYDAAR